MCARRRVHGPARIRRGRSIASFATANASRTRRWWAALLALRWAPDDTRAGQRTGLHWQRPRQRRRRRRPRRGRPSRTNRSSGRAARVRRSRRGAFDRQRRGPRVRRLPYPSTSARISPSVACPCRSLMGRLGRCSCRSARCRRRAARLSIGRDAARASLVIAHAAVSGLHATVMLDRMTVVDHGSTSGTWVAGRQIAANQPTAIDAAGVVAFGPVPVAVSLLAQWARGPSAPGASPAPSPSPAAAQAPPRIEGVGLGPTPTPGGPAANEAPRKHRTVIGELHLDGARVQASSRSAERRDNQIVVNHPQVSSKHAQIVKVGDELFLEDRGSANGTFVRGQRLAAGPARRRGQRREGLHRPDAAPHPHRRTATSTSSSKTRRTGPASRSTRSKRGISSSRCPIATTRPR